LENYIPKINLRN